MRINSRTLISIPIILLILIASFTFLKIPYSVESNGIIVPATEWRLEKTADGIIINILKDNLNNTVPKFTVTEFQRGDHVTFKISDRIKVNTPVKKGDTIGVIHSHLEQLRLIQLKGELEEKKRLRQVYLTGDKPELITAAYENMRMAETELETQTKQFERAKLLHQMQVIADQELELTANDYNVKQQQLNISRAQYQSLITGSKKEEILLIDATIVSLQNQIETTNERIEAFVITAPISGILSTTGLNNVDGNNSLARIISADNMILHMPVELNHLNYIHPGMQVFVENLMFTLPVKGFVNLIDSNVEQINQRQVVFVSSQLSADNQAILPNIRVKARIDCGSISLTEYLKRLTNTIYHN